MTQDAVVTRTFHNSLAEVAVKRSTACGSNCGNCESCVFQNELKVTADNRIGARPGQKVVIESKSSKVYKAILMVYIMPIVLVLLGYAIAAAFGAGEGVCIAVSFTALAVSAALLVLWYRKRGNKDKISFAIISIEE